MLVDERVGAHSHAEYERIFSAALRINIITQFLKLNL